MSSWRTFRSALLLVAVAGLASGCVVVVGDRGEGEDWAVHWAGSEEVDPAAPSNVLAREVSGRLSYEPGLAEQDITVSAREGVVTLHGRVDSLKVLEEAMNVAAAAPGVTRVVSRLTVVMEVS